MPARSPADASGIVNGLSNPGKVCFIWGFVVFGAFIRSCRNQKRRRELEERRVEIITNWQVKTQNNVFLFDLSFKATIDSRPASRRQSSTRRTSIYKLDNISYGSINYGHYVHK